MHRAWLPRDGPGLRNLEKLSTPKVAGQSRAPPGYWGRGKDSRKSCTIIRCTGDSKKKIVEVMSLAVTLGRGSRHHTKMKELRIDKKRSEARYRH